MQQTDTEQLVAKLQLPHPYLSQPCGSRHALQERFIVSKSEVQVHRFVCKSGELVAEADHVDALHGCGVREAVKLLLRLIVQDVVLGIGDEAVHIIVPSCYHLEE